jgi:hypothetical protein
MVRLAGLEPTASASAGLRSILLSYKRPVKMVPKERFELSRPCGHYALNVARLPFRHFGNKTQRDYTRRNFRRQGKIEGGFLALGVLRRLARPLEPGLFPLFDPGVSGE